MKHARKTLMLSAVACLVAFATSALAQDASAGTQGFHSNGAPAAPKARHAKYAIPPTATAEVGDSNCRLEIFDINGVRWPSYQTMCGPR